MKKACKKKAGNLYFKFRPNIKDSKTTEKEREKNYGIYKKKSK